MENQNPNKKTETDGSRKKQRLRQLMLLLLCVYAVILAAATFIEKEYGTCLLYTSPSPRDCS